MHLLLRSSGDDDYGSADNDGADRADMLGNARKPRGQHHVEALPDTCIPGVLLKVGFSSKSRNLFSQLV